MRKWKPIVVTFVAVLVAAGCQAIAGIEERHYQALEGGTVKEASALCKTYCTTVMDVCQPPNAVYRDIESCYGVCALLPEGDSEASGDSTRCRLRQATLASRTTDGRADYCVGAGPGGGDACGSNCESYCYLYSKACPDLALPVDKCQEQCRVLRKSDHFDVDLDYGRDTLECRLLHVSSASTQPDPHCVHAGIAPPVAPCVDPNDGAPDCNDYCRILMDACGGSHADGGITDAGLSSTAVYDNMGECLATCKALPRGTNAFPDGGPPDGVNTVGCRKYHSYNAVNTPETHCPHAGPAGDGTCSIDNCDSYCGLVQAACKDEGYTEHFGTDKDACNTECETLKGAKRDSGYNIDKATGNTVQCRILHTTRALAFADSAPTRVKTECTAALGDSPPCQ